MSYINNEYNYFKDSNKDQDIYETSTYVNGLGFIQHDPKKEKESQIRQTSVVIGFVIILFTLLKLFLVMPVTRIFYMLGFNIVINSKTGMILVDPIVSQYISFTVTFLCYLFSGILLNYIFTRPLKPIHFTKFPAMSFIKTAAPISIAMGVLGIAISKLFCYIFSLVGVVFPNKDYVVMGSGQKVIVELLFAFILVPILQELFFRGVLIYTLRRFGDGFAIVISTALFTITRNGYDGMIAAFFIGLCLSYFVIRTNSVLSAIILRVIFSSYIILCIMIKEFTTTDLAFMIMSLMFLIVLAFAIYSYILIIKNDKKFFCVSFKNECLTMTHKVLAFSTTFSSWILIILALINCINKVQLIRG